MWVEVMEHLDSLRAVLSLLMEVTLPVVLAVLSPLPVAPVNSALVALSQ
jgi:hypothetical protein